jgi:hypothetical protein
VIVESVLEADVAREVSVRVLGCHPDLDGSRAVAEHDALTFFEERLAL